MDKQRLLELICFAHAIVGAVFGIIFIFFADFYVPLLWPTTDTITLRVLGAAIIGFGFGSIIAWKRVDWEKVRIIIEVEMLWLTIAIIVMFYEVLLPLLPWVYTPSPPILIWVYIVLFIAFDAAFFYVYYLFRKS
ncbi:MAG: hypothetical protein ACFFBP_07045 [Promethearchaeota archaeon]